MTPRLSRPFRSLLPLLLFPSLFSAASAPQAEVASSVLPESPGAVYSSSASESIPPDPAAAMAPAVLPFPTEAPSLTGIPSAPARIKYISPGEIAPPQRVQDKFLLGIRESLTPYTAIGWTLSAGWGYLIDGSPNYGVNGKAYAQRLGAAAVLNSSKEIFSDSIFSPVFRQDPRYYQLGRQQPFFHRGFYAVSRPILGRTDSGKTIPNFATILGTGAATALTQAYYPDRNINGPQFARTWATSLGGSALGYLVSEYGDDLLEWAHLKKRE